MDRIELYQAMWGMEQLPDPASPYSNDVKVNMIKEAGFIGALNFIDDSSEEALAQTYELSDLIKAGGLKLALSCNGFDEADIKGKIDYAKSVDAVFINIMVKNYFLTDQEALELLEAAVKYGQVQEVQVYIETHRGTVTQDLKRTVAYTESIEEMLLTVDLSHYVVAGEFTEENLALYAERIPDYFDVLLKRLASLHVRLSNGEQVQIPLNRISENHLEAFKSWWRQGIQYALDRMPDHEKVPVIIELGPEDYQQKILSEGKWIYDCDRWEEALAWKKIFEDL